MIGLDSLCQELQEWQPSASSDLTFHQQHLGLMISYLWQIRSYPTDGKLKSQFIGNKVENFINILG